MLPLVNGGKEKFILLNSTNTKGFLLRCIELPRGLMVPLMPVFLILFLIFSFGTVNAFDGRTVAENERVRIPEIDGFPHQRVVIVTLDRLFLEDFKNYSGPLLSTLLDESGVTLMNVNTAGSPETDGGYATLGAGARLQGHWSVRLAFNREESHRGSTAEALYMTHTGMKTPPRGALIHPYWMSLLELNRELPYPAHVGVLGETLRLNGLNTAVLGNADHDEPGRQAVSIAMDSLGMVTFGDVSSSLLKINENAPYGFSSDPRAYLEALYGVWQDSSLIVIEWGDSSRIDAYREHLPPGRREQLLTSSLAEFDQLLEGILSRLDHNTLLMLLSPSPPQAVSGIGQRMTPLILYDSSRREGGVLRSATTRRPGIVTNIDIAPTVLQHLGVDAPFFLWGAPLEFVPASNNLETLVGLSTHTARIYQQRPPIIRGYILSLIIVSLLGVFAVITRFKSLYGLRYILVVLLNVPAVLLVAAFFSPFPAAETSQSMLWLILIAVPVMAPALLLMRRNLMACFAYSGLTICTLLMFDLWFGAPLNSRSLFGYDPISGARFYGLGNEYMGVLLGAFILGSISVCSLLLHGVEKYKNYFIIMIGSIFAAASLLLVFFMSSPAYGANFGGSITAGFALAVTLGSLILLPEWKRKTFKLQCLSHNKMGYNNNGGEKKRANFCGINVVKTAIVGTFLLVTALFVYYLNVPGGGDPVSHLGRTWELVRSDGIPELGNVTLRKLSMNLKLFRFSLWSRVFLGFIGLLVILYYYPVGLMRSVFSREPFFKAILGGTIAGSIVAFCMNDSGVVAAATVMLYGGLPLFLLSLREVFS